MSDITADPRTVQQLREDLELADWWLWLCSVALEYEHNMPEGDAMDYRRRFEEAKHIKNQILNELLERGEQIE